MRRSWVVLSTLLAATRPATADFAGDLTIGLGISHATSVFTADGSFTASTVAPTLVFGFSLGGSDGSQAYLLRGRALTSAGALGGFFGPSVRWTLSDRLVLHTGVGAALHAVTLGRSSDAQIGGPAYGVGLAIRIERAFNGFALGVESSPILIPAADSNRNTRLWEMAVTVGTYR
jgi:hypothetical protein